jgi:hypothetical protein
LLSFRSGTQFDWENDVGRFARPALLALVAGELEEFHREENSRTIDSRFRK